MDNVKDLINKFVLSEDSIDVENLRVNIETLSELEELMDKTNRKLDLLKQILEKYKEAEKKDKDIIVNDLLITRANIDYYNEEINNLEQEIERNKQYIASLEQDIDSISDEIKYLSKRLIDLNVSKENNESSRLIEGIQRRLEDLEEKIKQEEKNKEKLDELLDAVGLLLNLLQVEEIQAIDKEEFNLLRQAVESSEKIDIVQKLSNDLDRIIEEKRREHAFIAHQINVLSANIEKLKTRLDDLNRKVLTFPENTRRLKDAIEKEFKKQGINSRVYVLAELLEITDERWRNAVEGYFHLQKFNLIVEPEYYSLALSVYHSRRKEIHPAGIINTRKLQIGEAVDQESLAYVVHR